MIFPGISNGHGPAVTARRITQIYFLSLCAVSTMVMLPSKDSFADFNSVSLLASAGDAAPGLGAGITFNSVDSRGVNDNGEVLVLASVEGPGITSGNDQGAWIYSDGSLNLVAMEGDQVPGASPSRVFGRFSSLQFTENGSAFFFTDEIDNSATPGPFSRSFWFGDEGSLTKVMGTGDVLPGMGVGESVASPVCSSSALTTEFVICKASIAGSTSQDFGVWAGTPGNFQLIFRKGDPTPSLPGYVISSSSINFVHSTANGNGKIAISSVVSDGSSSSWALFYGDVNSLSLVVQSGDPAVGETNGETFGSLIGPLLDENDDLFFRSPLQINSIAGVTRENRTSSWYFKNGIVSKSFRSGDPAPGLTDGEVINFGDFHASTGETLDGVGGTLMSTRDATNSAADPYRIGSRLLGPLVNDFNNQGVWLNDGSGYELVLRDGDVAPGFTDGRVFNIRNGITRQINSEGQAVMYVDTSPPGQPSTSNTSPGYFLFSDGNLSLLATRLSILNLDNGDTVRIRIPWSSGSKILNNNGVFAFRASYDDGVVNPTNTPVTQGIFLGSLGSEPPVADAGMDQSIRVGDLVQLDGSASFDDNTATVNLVYSWSFASFPGANEPVINNADTASPSFVAVDFGEYALELIVIDEDENQSVPDTVLVSNQNLVPTAVIDGLNAVAVGTLVAADGSGSFDPENYPLTFFWEITSQPAGSTATLSDPTASIPTLVGEVVGDYTLTLVVSDQIGPSAPAVATFSVLPIQDVISILIMNALTSINGLLPSQMTNGGNQNAIENALNNALGQLDNGNIAQTISKIESVIERTDGCDLRGAPDGNGAGKDYITDCSAQAIVYTPLVQALFELNNL